MTGCFYVNIYDHVYKNDKPIDDFKNYFDDLLKAVKYFYKEINVLKDDLKSNSKLDYHTIELVDGVSGYVIQEEIIEKKKVIKNDN